MSPLSSLQIPQPAPALLALAVDGSGHRPIYTARRRWEFSCLFGTIWLVSTHAFLPPNQSRSVDVLTLFPCWCPVLPAQEVPLGQMSSPRRSRSFVRTQGLSSAFLCLEWTATSQKFQLTHPPRVDINRPAGPRPTCSDKYHAAIAHVGSPTKTLYRVMPRRIPKRKLTRADKHIRDTTAARAGGALIL